MLHSDIPIWPGTRIEFDSPHLIKYRVWAAAETVIQFYCSEMPRRGWCPQGGGPLGGGRAVLHYERRGVQLSLIIEPDHLQRTRVMLRFVDELPRVGMEEGEQIEGSL